ncbi:NAD(+) kinase [Malassezia cuniculi]|uniref:NAD(+) kinase n=1 Tax=Malassezia cuniculi TaxID=948313 RepID=A0AAF0EV52_9BASI|nr:NAD(+) kinase [Malassezia cuniculi]
MSVDQSAFTHDTPPSVPEVYYRSQQGPAAERLDDAGRQRQGSNPDERLGELTQQLARTAVDVREMSRQLGRARVESSAESVLIITKARDNSLVTLTRELSIWLMKYPRKNSSRGIIVYVDGQLRNSSRFNVEQMKSEEPALFEPIQSRWDSKADEGQLRFWTPSMCSKSPHLFDFVITLGGDGTVLFCSWLFQRSVPPVLPFSLGSLGFLTPFVFDRYKTSLTSALENGMRVNTRMRFTATIYRAIPPTDPRASRYQRRAIKSGSTGEIIMRNVKENGWNSIEVQCDAYNENPDEQRKPCKDKEITCFVSRPVETFEVLNDLVIDRGPSPYVSLLEVYADNTHLTTAQADGLCISTPTGSTAYSLSAGGSLVHPGIPAILITPICPHTLSFRPMLLPDSMELRIVVPYTSRSTAFASFDGRARVELKKGDHVKVTASPYPFLTVEPDDMQNSWFHSVSRTLQWNQRQQQKSFVLVEEHAPESRDMPTESIGNTPPRTSSTPDININQCQTMDSDEACDESDASSERADEFDIQDANPESAAELWKSFSDAQLSVKTPWAGQRIGLDKEGNPAAKIDGTRSTGDIQTSQANGVIAEHISSSGAVAAGGASPHLLENVTCDAFVVYGRDDSDDSLSD